MIAALSFITGPVGKWLAVALVICGLLTGVYFKGKADQHGSDQIHERKAVAAVQRDLDTCHANGQALETSLAAQNASIAAAKADGDRRAQMLADGLQQARAGRASAEQRAAKLVSHPPAGIDACARSEAARLAVLESLR